MSSDSVDLESSSTNKDLCLSPNGTENGLHSPSVDFTTSCTPTKDANKVDDLSLSDRKESTIKLPYPVVSDHRDPSSVLALLQKETQTTSKKILDVVQQIENCEKLITSNSQPDSRLKSLKYERVKLKQQLDALKKHERRISLQIDFVTTKIEIRGLDDERKQMMNEDNFEENKQINILLGKLKQKLDKMKIYMRTRNEQVKKIPSIKQQSSAANDTRPKSAGSHKTSQQSMNSSNAHSKRSLTLSTASSHSNKRFKSSTQHPGKVPAVRLASRSANHQVHSKPKPSVRFVNKSSSSSMTALNSSSPATPASSSSTLSPPSSATTTMSDANNISNSRPQIEIPSIDEDDELDLDLDIDELFNDDPYSEDNMKGFQSDSRQLQSNKDNSKAKS